MRVANLTMYNQSTYRLGGLTSDRHTMNEVMSTQKIINSVSDDPVGMSQVLDLRSSVETLTQIERNVEMGMAWLSEGENALTSVNELILSVKKEIARLSNDSMSADERDDAIEMINTTIDQIVALGNTQINGNYIFGGEDTDTSPLTRNRSASGEHVVYNGDDNAFGIKTDDNTTVAVGLVGSDTFWDDIVNINTTNNTIVFMEDNGHGSAAQKILTATLATGEYTPEKLELSLKNKLNAVSAEKGYGVTYDVSYDSVEKKFSIREDGSYDGYMATRFMWDSGEAAHIAGISSSGAIGPEGLDIQVNNPDALTIATPEPRGTEPFRLTWRGNGEWEVENNPGYVIFPSIIKGTDDRIEIDLDESGTPDITIALDTAAYATGHFIEFDIVPAQGDHSVGHEIGFNKDDTVYAPPVSDQTAVHVTELVIQNGVNDTIQFVEVDDNGISTAVLSADFAAGTYTDMDALAQTIEARMEAVSTAGGNGIDYSVSYIEEESRFLIRENGAALDELQLVWSNSALASQTGATLGFYPTDDVISYPENDRSTQMDITIDSSNNRLLFVEKYAGGHTSGELWATVPTGTYKTAAELETALETAMNDVSKNGVTYDVTYDDVARRFSIQRNGGGTLTGLELLWKTADDQGSSIGATLGFNAVDRTGSGIAGSYTGDNDAVVMRFDTTNNRVKFRETAVDGTVSDLLTAEIGAGDYTSMDDVASALQRALRDGSVNGVKYEVDYDYASGTFMVKGSDADIQSVRLIWENGTDGDRTAADMLGFHGSDTIDYSMSDEPVVNITIDSTNNKLDFRELMPGSTDKQVDILTASVKQGTYTSMDQLAREVEAAMEKASYTDGSQIDYSVSWDAYTKSFTIKENGVDLDGLELLWGSGPNAESSAGGTGQSIGALMGFDAEDEMHGPAQSQREVEWGIFNTLIDIKAYLADNDRDGLERTIGRLETSYKEMTSRIANVGIGVNRLEIRDKISIESRLSFTERKSEIEDADLIESYMKMQTIETAYQAALSSISRIMKLSLVDYL